MVACCCFDKLIDGWGCSKPSMQGSLIPVMVAMSDTINRPCCTSARGEMENRIKEQQQGLFADRTSAHQWWTNQFRLLLSSLAAYVLMETIRRLALHDTELAHAQVGTLRLKLLKIGAIILRNTRRIRFPLSAVECLSLSESLLRGRQAAGSRIVLDECCPSTLINNGVRGRCAWSPENTFCTARLRA